MSSAPPRRGLIDTPLLLAMRRGELDAAQFATDMLRHYKLDVSELTAMVLVAGCPDAVVLRRELAFLRNAQVHRVTAPISRRAFRILAALPPPSPLTADDALVASTALEYKLPLYTLDPGRFAAVPGLAAVRPY